MGDDGKVDENLVGLVLLCSILCYISGIRSIRSICKRVRTSSVQSKRFDLWASFPCFLESCSLLTSIVMIHEAWLNGGVTKGTS